MANDWQAFARTVEEEAPSGRSWVVQYDMSGNALKKYSVAGEIGYLSIHVFESLREPCVFAIHSEWADEAAFEFHSTLPHTVRFLAAAETLLTHSVQGLRLRHIGGGAGAAR